MVSSLNLRNLAIQYVSQRRAFGFQYRQFELKVFPYLEFLELRGERFISVSTVLDWRSHRSPISNPAFANIYRYIRGFSVWANHLDERNQLLPTGLFGEVGKRAKIHFYSTAEIKGMMHSALNRPSRFHLRRFTVSTFIGLLATTGIRIQEALRLDDGDVDLDKGIISIRESKSRYHRVIPIQKSTMDALSLYRSMRDLKSYRLGRKTKSFLMSERGTRPSGCLIRLHVYHSMADIGLRQQKSQAKFTDGPRIHDFRHSFAVRTMINWYEQGLNPYDEILKLTHFLGHTHIRDTYWYLEAVPELLHYVVQQSEGA